MWLLKCSIRVIKPKKYDATVVITVEIPHEYIKTVQHKISWEA